MSVLGVEGEERDDFTKAESRLIRDRSVRLLGSLLRPLRLRNYLAVHATTSNTGLSDRTVRCASFTARET